jgi:hypothetical protein
MWARCHSETGPAMDFYWTADYEIQIFHWLVDQDSTVAWRKGQPKEPVLTAPFSEGIRETILDSNWKDW